MTYLNFYTTILPFSGQPLGSQLLLHLFRDYRRPYDKIGELVNQGILVQLKRGLYLPGPNLPLQKPEPFLTANHLYGPSYVSYDAALSYWGLIPEKVVEIKSATLLHTKEFVTVSGVFVYVHVPSAYYALGLKSQQLAKGQVAILASPEKALMDKIIDTSGLQLRSMKQVEFFLMEDLRIDEEDLRLLDTNSMQLWMKHAPKKQSMVSVLNFLNRL